MIEIFDIDLTIFGAGIQRLHGYESGRETSDGGVTIVPKPIVFNGNNYLPAPITVEGFEISSKGLPTPQITIGNIMGQIGALVKANDGLQGATVTRTKLAQMPITHSFTNTDILGLPDVYIIDRPTNHTRRSITFDLKSIFDLNNLKTPRRVIYQQSCSWIYKSAQCGYTGSLPACARTIKACVEHFGEGQPLNFGGFTGVDRVQ
jgi:lambda family phage minor tail protein L